MYVFVLTHTYLEAHYYKIYFLCLYLNTHIQMSIHIHFIFSPSLSLHTCAQMHAKEKSYTC